MISSCCWVLTYDRWTDRRTDICDCRVAFVTVNGLSVMKTLKIGIIQVQVAAKQSKYY